MKKVKISKDMDSIVEYEAEFKRKTIKPTRIEIVKMTEGPRKRFFMDVCYKNTWHMVEIDEADYSRLMRTK